MGIFSSAMNYFGFGSSETTKPDASKPRASAPRTSAPRPRKASDMSEIITLEPQTYADAKDPELTRVSEPPRRATSK
jgi:FtsZ-interacting cell division protein YlmF